MAKGKRVPEPTQRAVGYVRTSTDKQEDSPDAQARALGTWAQALELHLDGPVIGQITSTAPLFERVALLEAIDWLEPGDVLVAVARDRFSRDVIKMALIERLVQQAGATLATTDGASSTATPEGLFMQSVMDAVAQLERASIATRTRRVMQSKKAKGEQIGSAAPFGWQHVDGMAVKHPLEQETIAEILYWRARGNSVAKVCQLLTESIYPPRGVKWHNNTITRIIAANSKRP